MKFDFKGPGRKKILIGIIISIILITIVVIVIFRRRAKYQYPVEGPDQTLNITIDSTTTNLPTAIAACTTKYRQAIQQGLTDSTPSKTQCIQTAVNAYFTAKCPFITTGAAPDNTATAGMKDAYVQFSGIGTKSDGTTVSGGGDAGAVTGSQQYVNLGYGTPPNGVTIPMVTRARKADLTGPTRKYIATACNGFYTPPDGVGPNDFSTTYTSWQVFTSAPASGYGFYAPYVTTPRIYEWALKAGTPITVSQEVPADTSATTTRTINVSPPFGTIPTQGTKIKLSGVTYSGTITVGTGSTVSSLVLSYPSQVFPTIPVGTSVNKSTVVAINSVTFGSGSATPLPITSPPTTPMTSVTLNLAEALDASLVKDSQVLLSGTTLTGSVTIGSYTPGTTTVIVNFNSQNFPLMPSGATIENVIETPYATPLVAPPPVYVKTDKAAGSTGASSTTVTVNAGGTTSSTTLGASPVIVTIPTITFTGASVIKASLSGTTLTLSSYAAGGTLATITWPAIPAGTIIFDSTGAPFMTAAGTTNDLYSKIGTMGTQKMYNWQIAQVVGPGTYWTGYTWGS